MLYKRRSQRLTKIQRVGKESRKTACAAAEPERIMNRRFLDRLYIFTFAQFGQSHPLRGLGHVECETLRSSGM